MPSRRRLLRSAILGPALVLAGCGASGETLVPLEQIRTRWGAPALGAAAFEGDRVTWLEVVGVRRLGDPTPATRGDLFHLGSCGKAMTAILVATFVDEGRLDWDARLDQEWPELAPLMHPEYRAMTLAHLLSHRAGIDDEALVARLGPALDTSLSLPEQRRWAAERVLSETPTRPGEYAYSNLGYTVVGALLENVGGASWEDLMVRRLFEPLGMLSCGFGTPGTPGLVDQPWGHLEQGGVLVPVEPGSAADADPMVMAPAGYLHCSLDDWAKFALLHLRGARGDAALVTSDSFERMHTPWPGGQYAFGWAVNETAGGPVLSHSGSNERSYAVVLLDVPQGRGAMAVANCGGSAGEGATSEALAAVMEGLR